MTNITYHELDLLDATNTLTGYIHEMGGNNNYSMDDIIALSDQGLIYLADMRGSLCQWFPTALGRAVLVREMIEGQYALDTEDLPFTDPSEDDDFWTEEESVDDTDWDFFDDDFIEYGY